MKKRKVGLIFAPLIVLIATVVCFAQGFYSYPSKSNTSASTGTFTTSVAIPEKTPVNAVASQGTITMSGIATVEVASQGTITMSGVATVEVASQGTITMSGVVVAEETFVVSTQEFTWVTSRSQLGECSIGTNASEAVTNIVTAITADLSDVTAVDGDGDTVVITAVTAGVAGDLIVLTEDSTNMAVDGTGTLGATTAGVDADTFVIDTQAFTWVTSRSGTGEVTVGAGAPAAVANIVTAITADLATVTAIDGDGDTVVVTAAAAGTAGDSIVFTEDSTNMAVDGAGTLGTTTAGVDADTFVIDDQAFTWKASRVGAGDVAVGASASEAVANIVTAITADLATVTAADGEGDTVVLTAATKGVAGNLIVLTEDSANMAVDGSGTLGTTTAGVDGTAGVKNEIACDGTYFYICIDTNTISDTNWKRMTVGDSY